MSTILEHPAFPQPDNSEVNLWRYLDYNKFHWLVTEERLLFPAAERLPDKLEGTQPIGDKAWWEEQAANAESEEQKNIITKNQELILNFSKIFLPNYYISCWHMNSTEDQKMWSSYTKSNDSVAVKTNYNILKQSLPNYTYTGLVRYIDYATDKLPSLNMFEYITHKHISYLYENEVRVVALPPAMLELGSQHFQDNLFELEAQPGFRFFAPSIEPKKIVQEIVLHPNSSEQFAKTVAGLCSEYEIVSPSRSIFS